MLHFSIIRRCFFFFLLLFTFVPLLYDHGDGTIHDRFGKFDEQTNGRMDGLVVMVYKLISNMYSRNALL